MYSEDFKQFQIADSNISRQVWSAWSPIAFHTPDSAAEVLNQILWFNHYIKRACKVWFKEKAY